MVWLVLLVLVLLVGMDGSIDRLTDSGVTHSDVYMARSEYKSNDKHTRINYTLHTYGSLRVIQCLTRSPKAPKTTSA